MLSVAEVCRQEKTLGFAASLCGDSWVYAWVHKRGALDKGCLLYTSDAADEG